VQVPISSSIIHAAIIIPGTPGYGKDMIHIFDIRITLGSVGKEWIIA
jgi:hypothetical protein